MEHDPVTLELASFLTELRWDHLDETARSQARFVLLETMGAMVGGSRFEHVEHLAAHAAETAPVPTSALLGFSARCAAPMAALANGCSATALEMVGGHRRSYGMPGIAAIPAALALAEEHDSSGRDLLEAVVAGYEIGARVSMACVPWRDPFHGHGSLSMVAAAVACARIKGFSVAEMAKLLDTAALLPIFAHRRTTWAGGTMHNAYPAVSAFNGVLSTEFVRAGLTAPTEGLQRSFGEIATEDFKARELVEGLGEGFEITRGYLKTYAGDRHLHSAIDALRGAISGHEIDAGSIEWIDVYTYFKAARCEERNPQNYLAARWSVPHALAAYLVLGHARWRAFTDEAVADEAIFQLRQRVRMHEDPDYTRVEPAERPARVEVRFRNGSCLEHTVRFTSGDPESPSTPVENYTRYLDAVDGVLDAEAAEQLGQKVLAIEELPDVRELTRLGTTEHQPESRNGADGARSER